MGSMPTTHSLIPFRRDHPPDHPRDHPPDHPVAGANRHPLPQASLLTRARAGDRAAFQAIFAQYEDAVYGYVCRLLGGAGGARDVEHACDLTQDVFLRAYLALSNVPEDAGVWVWLCRIATDVCLAAQRWPARIGRDPLALLSWGLRPRLRRGSSRTRREAAHPRAPRADDVQSILAEMRPKYRACLALREYCGLSYTEIGLVLSVSRTAVRSLVLRAREQFSRIRAATDRSTAA
ncbi:MAG TPA: sigma-70 family RNA polymerase sigma factor [Chloroflexota bacterium]|nr:sigma-70 family RNA polymerase sigma factor [Chloroflexota bacterium]